MLSRKVVMIGIALIVGLAVSVYLLYVPRDTVAPMCKVTDLATTSADEHDPVWSPDGSKIFFKLTESNKVDGWIERDTWICSVNTDGSQREKLVKIEHPDIRSNIVLSPDMKKVFYVKEISQTSTVLQIMHNDPKVGEEMEALAREYDGWNCMLDDKKRIGITDNIANVVVTAVIMTKSEDSTKLREEGHALDIYIDLRNETVTKVERIEEAKVPEGKEPKRIWQVYMVDIDGKNQEKIAELTLEDEYIDDWGYIGGTEYHAYDMHSWSPDRTKIFFTKLEETGYTWVWREEEGKWVRYKAGTEPSIPVVQWGVEENKLIAKEHEKTAWVWDLKDNELRFVGHLSYCIVHGLLQGEVVWSPDGKYVALPSIDLSEAGATKQIFVINIETGESRKLTSFVGTSTWPKWSGDSKKIVFARVPPDPEYWWLPSIFNYDMGSDVWVVDIDGSNETQLTDIRKNWEEGWLNPDGSKVVYASWEKAWTNVDETRKVGIWMVNVDGSDRKLLAEFATGGISCMEWSPDGSKIAIETWVLRESGFDRDIYLIDVA